MSMVELGRLVQVDLRSAWMSEAGEFTPWLARERNLGLLGEAIGLDLELEGQERNVGPFRADILCKDTATENWVLIENQLERTDHTHLGQLMTYAAGLKAVTIMWIANTFTEEHRAALDWLNEITDERFNFFGLEIELWRIGDSPAAPKFNVVCKPNNWTKTIAEAAGRIQDGELSETRRWQLEYWTELFNLMAAQSGRVRLPKALAQSWMNFAVGRTAFKLYAAVNARERWICCSLSVWGQHGKSHFHTLHAQQMAIEEELGFACEWRELPDKNESQVLLRMSQVTPTDRSDWLRQHQWFSETLNQFHRVFSQRVKGLGREGDEALSDEALSMEEV